jgi:hypothetical protein
MKHIIGMLEESHKRTCRTASPRHQVHCPAALRCRFVLRGLNGPDIFRRCIGVWLEMRFLSVCRNMNACDVNFLLTKASLGPNCRQFLQPGYLQPPTLVIGEC